MIAGHSCHIPVRARQKAEQWRTLIQPILSLPRGAISTAIRELSARTGIPEKTIEGKVYAARRDGLTALVDRRLCGPQAWASQDSYLSDGDKQTLKTYAERYQRTSAAAVREMRRDWRHGRLHTDTKIDLATGYPRGWSESNLMRHLPSRFELAVARIGRSAGAAERRLVYTTRKNLWVGSHYLFDDMWHNHMVNVLDTQRAGRPMEFHALDLYSACKFAWGMRVRTERADGTMEGLKEAEMRFLLALVLSVYGYSPRGTVLVVEHGTAAIREPLARLLHDESNGLITVARSGMEGASAAAHQYAGRSKGNFRFKAALESLGNLIQNEMAYLPGQTGKDIDHRPEQLHGLLKHNDALLIAVAQLPPERAAMLHFDLITIQQFRSIADEIYARINARTHHDLEGWDDHYVPVRRSLGAGGSGLSMRRLSPTEVFQPGSRQLTKLRPETIALILYQDNAVVRMTKRGMFELSDPEVTGDLLRFDAHFLKDREKFATVLNPFDPSALWAFDSKGRFLAACPRILSVCRGDVAAVQRQCGEAAKVEAERLAPYRARHIQEAREKAAMHRHNADVLGGDRTPSRLPSTADREALSVGDDVRSREFDDYASLTIDEGEPKPSEDIPSAEDLSDLL